jgi:hypothetical protein
MYDELISSLRNNADHYAFTGDNGLVHLLTDAADAIEALICEVATEHNARLDAEERQRWVPVTERLPELHDAEYLDEVTGEPVRYKESMPVLIWLAKGGFMDIGIYEKSDAVDDFCYQGIPHTVTYWMPLPDAPEEGE